MPLDITLPTTAGETRSISRYRGGLVLVVAESRNHLPINATFKKNLEAFVKKSPKVAKQIELVAIAQLQKEPSFARSIVDAFVTAEAKRTGTVIWLDCKGEALSAIGQRRDVDTPAYLLLDKLGDIRWGRFGKIHPEHEQALLEIIHSLLA